MGTSFRKKSELNVIYAMPGIATLGFMVLCLIILKISVLSHQSPLFALIGIYFWSLYRPRLFPYWFVFLLGIMQDALFGTPMGLSSFLFIAFRLLVASQRAVFSKEAFWAIWLGFTIMTFILHIVQWSLIYFFYGHPVGLHAGMVQWLITAASYPLIHAMFERILSQMPPPASYD